MPDAPAPHHDFESLRARAEIQMRSGVASLEPQAPLYSANELNHELHVHQIELEMQNDELRQTVEKLESSRERYFELYDLAPFGYLGFSEKGLILETNLTAATMLGGTRNSLLNQPLSRFLLPEDLGNYFEHRKKLFDTQQPQSSELQLLTASGALSWIRLESTHAHGASGAPIGRAAMINVTRAKATERMLAQKSRELEVALSQLAALKASLCENCKKLPRRR